MTDPRSAPRFLVAILAALAAAVGGVAPATGGESSDDEGALFQVVLEVRDMGRMAAFYRDVLGLELAYPVAAADLADESFVRFRTPGAALALHAGRGPEERAGPARLSFRSGDLIGRRKALLERGVELGPIRNPAPGTLVSDGRDPEGNRFHVEAEEQLVAVLGSTVAEVLTALRTWVSAFNAGDWDAYLDFYSDDPRLHVVEQGRHVYFSKEEISEAVRGFYSTVERAELAVEWGALEPVGPGLMLVPATFAQRVGCGPDAMMSMRGTMTVVLQLEEDRWRLLTGHNEVTEMDMGGFTGSCAPSPAPSAG